VEKEPQKGTMWEQGAPMLNPIPFASMADLKACRPGEWMNKSFNHKIPLLHING
jgi:hypothetical protein